MVLRYFTRGDIALIIGLLILSGGGFTSIPHYTMENGHAVVDVGNRRVLELSLDTNVTKTVTGPLGKTVIVVKDGTVRITDSPCPHHYCVRMGTLRNSGEIAVCVPNRVVVTVRGGSGEKSFDGVTQ